MAGEGETHSKTYMEKVNLRCLKSETYDEAHSAICF